MMNLTQQARYLSSNSGGSWFNSAFSYQVRAAADTQHGDTCVQWTKASKLGTVSAPGVLQMQSPYNDGAAVAAGRQRMVGRSLVL